MSRNDVEILLDDLSNAVLALTENITNLNRRVSNIIRPARVTKVDADKYTHRVAYTVDENGQDVETTDIPWAARAGKIRDWSPPTVGEQVFLISPSGDINENSFTMPGGFTQKYPPNHNKEGEQKVSVGDGSNDGNKESSTLTTASAMVETADHKTDVAKRVDHNKRS